MVHLAKCLQPRLTAWSAMTLRRQWFPPFQTYVANAVLLRIIEQNRCCLKSVHSVVNGPETNSANDIVLKNQKQNKQKVVTCLVCEQLASCFGLRFVICSDCCWKSSSPNHLCFAFFFENVHTFLLPTGAGCITFPFNNLHSA